MQPRAQAVPRSLQCNDREGMKIPVIGSPRDFVYPGSLFFDTRYHLNAAGRELRTQAVIRILRSRPGIDQRDAALRKAS